MHYGLHAQNCSGFGLQFNTKFNYNITYTISCIKIQDLVPNFGYSGKEGLIHCVLLKCSYASQVLAS